MWKSKIIDSTIKNLGGVTYFRKYIEYLYQRRNRKIILRWYFPCAEKQELKKAMRV